MSYIITALLGVVIYRYARFHALNKRIKAQLNATIKEIVE